MCLGLGVHVVVRWSGAGAGEEQGVGHQAVLPRVRVEAVWSCACGLLRTMKGQLNEAVLCTCIDLCYVDVTTKDDQNLHMPIPLKISMHIRRNHMYHMCILFWYQTL